VTDRTDPGPSPDAVAGTRSSRRRRWPFVVPIVFLAVVALVAIGGLAAGSWYAVKVDQAVNKNIQRTEELPPETPVPGGTHGTDGTEQGSGDDEAATAARPKRAADSKAMNYLLLGADAPAGGGSGSQRSDVMMLLHLDGDRKSATLISFPRDMYVSIPGYGKNKINAAYAFGGTPLAVRTVEGLLDVRIDHVALIDFEGFVQLTDDLGGISINNTHASASRGYTFPEGEITISGNQALVYVRERYDLPRGDLDRAARQRSVVKAILSKGLSPEMLADPERFLAFAGDLAKNIRIDKSLTEDELRSTALSLRMTPKDIHQIQAPISGFGTSPTKQSIDIVDTKKIRALGAALRADDLAGYRATYGNG
jgi:polyisoprenyl-teichoic acid--peptidoglycan teichoic acid transferase